MTDTKPYFSWRQILLMLVLALAGAFTFYYFPVADIRWPGPFMQPGSAFALFGGIFFVFWIALSRLMVNRKYAVLVTAIFMASFGGILSPDHLVELHGLASPVAFFIFRYVSILIIGLIIELISTELSWRGLLIGGLANLAGAGLIWVAIAIKAISPWEWLRLLSLVHYVVYALAAVLSGGLGVLLSHLIGRGVKTVLLRTKTDA